MDLKESIQFILQAGILKNLPRSGWLLRGIKNPESVADHSYRTALISALLGDLLKSKGVEVDLEKIMRMALLHDLAETQVGDITPKASQYLGRKRKKASEEDALKEMVSGLGNLGKLYHLTWSELNEGISLESKIVKAADKFEMMLQAYEYERSGLRNLSDFWENIDNLSEWDLDGILIELIQLLKSMRKEIER